MISKRSGGSQGIHTIGLPRLLVMIKAAERIGLRLISFCDFYIG